MSPCFQIAYEYILCWSVYPLLSGQDLVGEVLLSLRFLPTSQRLEVGLLKVRMLPTEMCSDAGK